MLRPLRGKKFTPQVPREELLARTSESLRYNGVDHHSQASLMLGIAKLVLETNSPLISNLRGHPKLRDTIAWTRAYTIVTKFLQQFQMDLTGEIFQAELDEHHIIPDLSILRGTNSSQILSRLVQFGTTLDPDPLEHEVAVFSGQRIVKRTTRQSQASRYFSKPEREESAPGKAADFATKLAPKVEAAPQKKLPPTKTKEKGGWNAPEITPESPKKSEPLKRPAWNPPEVIPEPEPPKKSAWNTPEVVPETVPPKKSEPSKKPAWNAPEVIPEPPKKSDGPKKSEPSKKPAWNPPEVVPEPPKKSEPSKRPAWNPPEAVPEPPKKSEPSKKPAWNPPEVIPESAPPKKSEPSKKPAWNAPEVVPEPVPPKKSEPSKKPAWNAPEDVPEPVPPKKSEPSKKPAWNPPEVVPEAVPPKKSEPPPQATPVFKKPTIGDLKAAPTITLDSDFASSSVPEEKSSRTVNTDEDTLVEDFDSDESVPEAAPSAHPSSSAALASDDFDVTVVDSESGGVEEVESVVDEGSTPVGSLRSEMIGESNQMMIQLPSSIVGSSGANPSRKSDLDFEFADENESDVIEIEDDFDD